MINLLNYFFIMFFIVQTALAFDPLTNRKRALLFFIDDSESSMPIERRAVFKQLMIAIAQKSGPMVVSRSLLALLASEYMGWQKMTNTTPEFKESLANFYNPNDWHIKEINPFIYLLMPVEYLKKFNIKNESFTTYSTSKESTEEELILGLKINHMKNKKLENISFRKVPRDYFTPAVYHTFPTIKSNIFCLNSEYASHPTLKHPQWSFYMLGHGQINSAIVGLSLQAFRNFLDIIGSKITTQFLIYQSCYAMGYNAYAVYKDLESNMLKTYPYTIMIGTITDSVAYVLFCGDVINDTLQLNPKTTIDYKKFFTQIIDSDVIDYHAISENIFRDMESSEILPNIPQIKLPGLEWFSVLDTKRFFYIGNNFARSRTQPLKISTQKAPQIILISASYIPFEMIINIPQLQAILSMLPGNATHFIKKITSNISFNYIVKIFTQSKPGFNKNFFIEDIEINAQSIFERTKIQNLFFDYNPLENKWYIFYTIGNALYTYNNHMQISITRTPGGFDVHAYKERFKNIKQNFEQIFVSSPLVHFDFLAALKKSKELEVTFDKLMDFQNLLLILQSVGSY